MPDSTGRNDSGEKSANSPLVRGSAKQSRDQDGQACDEGSWPARDEAGRNSSATERNLNPDAIGLRPVDNPSFGNFPFKHPVEGGGDVCDSSSAGIASHWGAPANLSSKKWQQCPVACCCRQVNNGKFDAVRSQHRHEGARSAVRSFENVPCTSKTG